MDKLRMETPDMVQKNIEAIGALFPNCVTEARGEDGAMKRAINFDMLRQMLTDEAIAGDEAYEFTWVGKKEAMVEASRPIRKTLRPCKEESKDWDTTENLYIEGDNLDVLKLLQESYLGKVKMIYIDPPYNTGHDFIYRDNFARSKAEEERQMGMFDEETEEQLFENTESNGRFHSDWCSMIYPRLMVARNILADDGVIFLSIDDAEVENLRKICDEVFGEQNFVACLVYDKNRKNDAKYFSVGHEYILVYFKSIQVIFDKGILFREPKEGVEEVKTAYTKLRKTYGNDWDKIGEGLKELYASWANSDPRKPLARFTKVDEKGPYRDDGNISWPGGGGPKYAVLHPITGKPCKCPDGGWRFPTPSRMQEEIDNGRVVFGPDETTLPRIRRNLFDYDEQVMRSVHFSYAQTATLEFNSIFDGIRVFENPKSTTDIQKLIRYIVPNGEKAVVLDFFSGSATTAHAVMRQNAEDGGQRKFIMVQLPEKCDEKSEAYKVGYRTICDIGKERIRRAGEKIKSEAGLLAQNLDVGFRVLKLDESNMKDVYYSAAAYTQDGLAAMESNIKEDRSDLDLLYGCLLAWALPLSLPYCVETIDGCTVHTYGSTDPAEERAPLKACFDEKVPESVVRAIAARKPLRVVFRDSSFASSPERINVEEIFKLLAPNTSVRVI